jgi:hypothetical protein
MSQLEPAILGALGLLFTVGTVTLGVVVRIVARSARDEQRLQTVIRDMGELVRDNADTHRELAGQMREDRHATNERLTYLERYVWPRAGRGGAR